MLEWVKERVVAWLRQLRLRSTSIRLRKVWIAAHAVTSSSCGAQMIKETTGHSVLEEGRITGTKMMKMTLMKIMKMIMKIVEGG